MKPHGLVFPKIGLFAWVGALISTAALGAEGGYRCEGLCAGVDYAHQEFYDLGFMSTDRPSSPDISERMLAYRQLRKKCETMLELANVDAKYATPAIVKSVQTTQTTTREDWHHDSYTYGPEVSEIEAASSTSWYRDYTWIRIRMETALQSSQHTDYTRTETKTSLKVEQRLSADSCYYVPSLTVPTYDGPLPAQG